MIEQLIAEATECDFKVALETKKPKSWLKSVSAFSNGIGGPLFFGVSDDREPIGLSDVQKDAEAISRLIKERITPLPQFILKPLQEDGKNLLALEVSPGRSTPYYYKADGLMEAYILSLIHIYCLSVADQLLVKKVSGYDPFVNASYRAKNPHHSQMVGGIFCSDF